jgi:hypothetical protein
LGLSITFFGWRQTRTPAFRQILLNYVGAGTPATPSNDAMGAAVIMLRSLTAAALCQKKGQKFYCTDEEMTEFCNKNFRYLDKVWARALGRK